MKNFKLFINLLMFSAILLLFTSCEFQSPVSNSGVTQKTVQVRTENGSTVEQDNIAYPFRCG